MMSRWAGVWCQRFREGYCRMQRPPGIDRGVERRRRRPLYLVVVGISILSQLLACGTGPNVRSTVADGTAAGLVDDTKKAGEVLTDAIDKLSKSSADWQVIGRDAIDKLPDVKDVRESVGETLETAIGATRVEFRCNVDFLRLRVREE